MIKIKKRINIFLKLLLLNILWIVTSLPIITIGSSTTALFFIIGKMLRKEDYQLFKDYFRSYIQNLIQGIFLSIFSISIFVILINGLIYALNNKVSIIIIIMGIILFIEFALIQIYMFAFLSRYEMKLRNLFALAIYLVNFYLKISILLILFLIGLLISIYYIPVSVFFIFSIFAFLVYKQIIHLVEKDWNSYWSQG